MSSDTINYGKEMQLLSNQGNEAISFEAKYQEDFSRVLATQTGSTAGAIHFGIDMTDVSQNCLYTEASAPTLCPVKESSKHRTTDLFGLSVLTHNDPSQFPVSPGS